MFFNSDVGNRDINSFEEALKQMCDFTYHGEEEGWISRDEDFSEFFMKEDPPVDIDEKGEMYTDMYPRTVKEPIMNDKVIMDVLSLREIFSVPVSNPFNGEGLRDYPVAEHYASEPGAIKLGQKSGNKVKKLVARVVKEYIGTLEGSILVISSNTSIAGQCGLRCSYNKSMSDNFTHSEMIHMGSIEYNVVGRKFDHVILTVDEEKPVRQIAHHVHHLVLIGDTYPAHGEGETFSYYGMRYRSCSVGGLIRHHSMFSKTHNSFSQYVYWITDREEDMFVSSVYPALPIAPREDYYYSEKIDGEPHMLVLKDSHGLIYNKEMEVVKHDVRIQNLRDGPYIVEKVREVFTVCEPMYVCDFSSYLSSLLAVSSSSPFVQFKNWSSDYIEPSAYREGVVMKLKKLKGGTYGCHLGYYPRLNTFFIKNVPTYETLNDLGSIVEVDLQGNIIRARPEKTTFDNFYYISVLKMSLDEIFVTREWQKFYDTDSYVIRYCRESDIMMLATDESGNFYFNKVNIVFDPDNPASNHFKFEDSYFMVIADRGGYVVARQSAPPWAI